MRLASVLGLLAAAGAAACVARSDGPAAVESVEAAAAHPAPCDLTCGRCAAEAADPSCCPPREAGHRGGERAAPRPPGPSISTS